jgi:aldose 1-epimerase
VLPSGEQTEIAFGPQRAVVVEVGGGLRAYSANGKELLDGYAADEMCTSGRGQLLLPWPNRLLHGRYEFAGRTHRLALTDPEEDCAIHGLVRWSAWRVAEREPHRAVLEHELHPQPGYPFSVALSVAYTLSADGLSVRTTATNVGDEPCPYGSGAHPYLGAGAPTVDRAILRAPARTVLHSDARGIPTGAEPVDGTEYDFRSPRELGPTKLDNGFTDLERDEDGIARFELQRPDEVALTLWVDQAYPYVMLFTGDPLPDVNRRSLAVEPMTCPPNAFRSGDAVIVLEPGESHSGTWGISVA